MKANGENSAKTGIEKRMENLKNGPRFSSEYQPKNPGRKKEVKNILKEFRHDVDDEVVGRIASVMLSALSCKSTSDAKKKLEEAEKSEPEFGWVFEQTIMAIKKDGLRAILDVLEWIFGKRTNVNVTGGLGVEFKPLVDLTSRSKNGSSKDNGTK